MYTLIVSCCHSKLDLESHHTLLRNNEILNQVQDDKDRHAEMTPLLNRSAFTLVELLVAILIVAILSSIAITQYLKAVEHARTTEAEAMLRTVIMAQREYYMNNNEFATSFSALDVDIPWNDENDLSAFTNIFKNNVLDKRCNKNWCLLIFGEKYLMALRWTGDYVQSGLGFPLKAGQAAQPYRKIYCVESTSPASDYCTKVMGRTEADLITGNVYTALSRFRVYKL